MTKTETTPAEREGEIVAEIARRKAAAQHANKLAVEHEAKIAALESELSALSAPVSDAPWTPGVGEYAHAEVKVYDTDGVTAGVEFPYKGKTAAMRLDVSCLRPAAAAPEGELSGNAGELPEWMSAEWHDTLVDMLIAYRKADAGANAILRYQAIRDFIARTSPSAAVDAEPVGYVRLNPEGKVHTSYIAPNPDAFASGVSEAYPIVPLYRHPSPVSGAVAAGKGVVDSIRGAAIRYANAYERMCRSSDPSTENYDKAWCELKAALAQIVELPEPSDWAKAEAANKAYTAEFALDVASGYVQRAAALIAAAKEGK